MRAKHDPYLPEPVPHFSDKPHAYLILGRESLPNWGEKDKLLPAYVLVLISYTQFRIGRTYRAPWLQRGRHQSSSVKPGWESCLLMNSVGWERNSLACCCCESILCSVISAFSVSIETWLWRWPVLHQNSIYYEANIVFFFTQSQVCVLESLEQIMKTFPNIFNIFKVKKYGTFLLLLADVWWAFWHKKWSPCITQVDAAHWWWMRWVSPYYVKLFWVPQLVEKHYINPINYYNFFYYYRIL